MISKKFKIYLRGGVPRYKENPNKTTVEDARIIAPIHALMVPDPTVEVMGTSATS